MLSDISQVAALDPHDVVIVGGGTAGLTLAHALSGKGLRILVLEAGGEQRTSEAQDFYRGEVTDPDYILQAEAAGQGTAAVTSHWMKRWLSARVRREETISKVACVTPENLALSRVIRAIAPVENREREDRNANIG